MPIEQEQFQYFDLRGICRPLIHNLWEDFFAIKKDLPVFYREYFIPDKKILVNCFYSLKLLCVLFHNGNTSINRPAPYPSS